MPNKLLKFVRKLTGQLTVGLALRASIANSQLPLSKALVYKKDFGSV